MTTASDTVNRFNVKVMELIGLIAVFFFFMWVNCVNMIINNERNRTWCRRGCAIAYLILFLRSNNRVEWETHYHGLIIFLSLSFSCCSSCNFAVTWQEISLDYMEEKRREKHFIQLPSHVVPCSVVSTSLLNTDVP